MDIKKFVIIDWIERDMLLMKRISTSDNFADAMTKPMGRQLHYRHMDYILGKCRPNYAKYQTETNTYSITRQDRSIKTKIIKLLLTCLHAFMLQTSLKLSL